MRGYPFFRVPTEGKWEREKASSMAVGSAGRSTWLAMALSHWARAVALLCEQGEGSGVQCDAARCD
jgi:hypothetical protein